MRILNLGAGVQSTTVYLMALRGEIEPIDYAIFADTQEEPQDVYKHLEWLISLRGPKIYVRTAGKLGDDLIAGRNSTGQQFASIPAFTGGNGIKTGMIRRQCTSEYKIAVITKTIKREILGLQPRQRVKEQITQIYGISFDERGRTMRIRERSQQWSLPEFPLVDRHIMRFDCIQWLRRFPVPHEVPRSACVFCPYHSNDEWRRFRDTDPAGWQRAVDVDASLRVKGNIINRNMNQQLFVHRDCVPLDEVNLDEPQQSLFFTECEGMCGV